MLDLHAQNAFYSQEAELSVIGSMLMDAETLMLCAQLSPEDFHDPRMRAIYAAIDKLHNRREKVDMVTVDAQLQKDLGAAYVNAYVDNMIAATQFTPTTANAGMYVKIIRDKADRRKLLSVARELQGMVANPEIDVADAIQQTRSSMRDVTCGADLWVSAKHVMLDTYALLERRLRGEDKPIQTGLSQLDKFFFGFVPGELTVIGARPGVGKSAFAGFVAGNAARNGKRVAIASLEMSSIQYGQRMLANGSGVDAKRIRDADLDPDSLDAVVLAMSKISDEPISFAFRCRTIERLMASVQQRKDDQGVDLLIVDYMQLMRTERKLKSEYERVTYISQMLKEMAAMLEIPVIALAQLSRAGRERSDKRPILSDLRDSGSIEQDADNVIFLHRPDSADDAGVYNEDKPYFDGYAKQGLHYLHIGIHKQRQGQIGAGNLIFDPRTQIFKTIDRRF